jgi:hypothetical protein
VDRGAARQDLPGLDALEHLRKQFPARIGIGVDEHQPLAARLRGAGIARASDLVHRLEHYRRARRARDLGGAIGRVVVADDELGAPAGFLERRERRPDSSERAGEQALFVERRHDHRQLHAAASSFS